jgi:hypothetical protein
MATRSSQPVSAYLVLLILGFLPLILVALFYDDLPHRFIVQWSGAGLSITGTRAKSAMTIAMACAAIALFAVLVAAIQNDSFKASGIRRLFLALNFAQIVTIGLTCAMLVGEAVGFPLQTRDVVPPSAALLLVIAGLLCLRLSSGATARASRIVLAAAGCVFLSGAVAIAALTIIFVATPLSWAAIGVALVAALALAVPEPSPDG